MIINLSKQDPDDPQTYIESERSRSARQRELHTQVTHEIRSAEIASKRAERLDRYFSKTPPNGKKLDIFRDALLAFKNTNGEAPMWLTYEQLEASFARLQRAGVLAVEVTEDSFGVKTIKSQVTADALANRRNVRPAELDALVTKLKQDIALHLDEPPIADGKGIPVHGCRYVPAINKWRVSLYFGGFQRALGCYSFSTALRLQDALAFHFSAYRRPGAYNTSEQAARELLSKHLFLQAFASGLETHWLATGVLHKPEEIISTECRLTALEKQMQFLLDEVLKLVQNKAT